MYKSLTLILIVLTIGLVSVESSSQADEKPPTAPLTKEEQKAELAKLREIFASVDTLPAKEARWVEVQAGSADRKTWHKGWLLHESDTEIQLLTGQGSKETFDKKKLAAKKPPSEFKYSDAWAVRNADFAKHCRDFMAEKKKEVKDDSNEFGVYRFQRERAEADAAVLDAARLATWASATGNEDIAALLLKRAVDKLEVRRSTYPGLPASDKLHQFVAGQTYPHSQDNLSTLFDEQDPRASRLSSLEWNQALAKIPYREDHEATMKKIKQLESLIAEDKAWKEPTKEEFAKLDVKQQATYWLHHLRDLYVTQTSSPGMCIVLTDSPRSFMQSQDLGKKGTPNPAVELKKLGYEVLPQIIAHLEDDRPTRCVGFWRHYSPEGYYTLTYGDCCQQIFEAIALHSIYERKTTSGYPLSDGQGKQCKERAEKWWQEFQKKGEKQVLIDGTKRGDRDSYLNAERLVKKFPEVAFDPLQEGIRAAKEDWIRSNLLNYMRDVKDERVVAFLFEQAKAKGPHLDSRVNALEGLLERDQEEAVVLLIAEWIKLDPEQDDWDDRWGPERLQDALVRCGKEKAIAALAEKWKKIPLKWRHRSLESFQDVDKDFAKKPFTPAASKAVDELLISCLSDREEGYHLQRTCDLAANALAVRWGDPKLFDLSKPLSVRNRKIVEVENVWRKKQELKPLPVPEARRIPPVADSTIEPLLKTLVEASSAPARRDASGAVERLGLGALPRVNKELASLPEDHPAREALSNLASRLACTVNDVRFSDDSVARPDNMRKAAESLKNQPLSEKALVELLVGIHKLVPAESGGFVIALDRDGDDTGIQLEIRVLPRRDPGKDGAVHLRRHEVVVVDGQELLSHSSATVSIGQETQSEWDSAEWKSLVPALQQALKTAPAKQFQVRVEVTRGR